MVSTGTLIWISCRPLLKMLLCTTSGFVLAKYDLFDAIAARGAAQVLLNVTFPCLMFSKMVPAFTPQNVGALGPLIAIGCIYQTFGLLLALGIRELFWVPHRFRSGLLIAGTFSNWGDVPTAVIMSITAAAPYGGPNDVNLGVSYVSAFILVFFIGLFPLGGHLLIAKDFEGPDREDEEVKEALAARQRGLLRLVETRLKFFRVSPPVEGKDLETVTGGRESEQEAKHAYRTESPLQMEDSRISQLNEITHDTKPYQRSGKRVSFKTNSLSREIIEESRVTISGTASTDDGQEPMSPTTTIAPEGQEFGTKYVTELKNADKDRPFLSPPGAKSLSTRILDFIQSLISPATISIVVSFPIALIKPLKGLFISFDDSPIPNAPDGNPPLYFVMDTANFLGAASVPLGLVCLGTALAKLKMPHKWSSLPLGAIGSLAIGKLIISPVLGVLLVNGFVKIGLISEEDKVLRFVAMFFSCMPTATTQVIFTQIYSGTGEAEHLAPFLIPQYALMFLSTTFLTAYSLHLLF